MTQQSLDAFDSILRYFAGLFATDARRLALCNDTKTISSREIQTAVQLLLTPELAKNAVTEGTNAVTKYSSFESSRQSDKQSEGDDFKAPKTMKQIKAGLVFSVSLVDNEYLRNQGVNVGQGAPVYLAAVLEYLAAELLELSGNRARDDGRTRIQGRDIFHAVSNDPEFGTLFSRHNLELLGTGVVPNIDQRILISYEEKSKTKKRNTAASGGAKSAHRYRPGTVALREIRSQQKSTKLKLCNAHMQEACKEITKEFQADVMMSQEARTALHYLVEQQVVRAFQRANQLCLHTGRTTMYVEDLQMALAGEGVVEGSGASLRFTQPPITLLARRAGIYRMSGEAWKCMKDYIHCLLTRYLRSAVLVLQHQGRQSINLKVLCESLATVHNVNLCVIPRKIRRSKKARGYTTESATEEGGVNDDDLEEADGDHANLPNEEDMDDAATEEGDVEEVLDDDEALDDVVEEPVSTPTRSNTADGKAGARGKTGTGAGKRKTPKKKSPAKGRKRQGQTATK